MKVSRRARPGYRDAGSTGQIANWQVDPASYVDDRFDLGVGTSR